MTQTCANSLDRWLPTIRRPSRGGMRLFCFPYAGGGASVFRDWTAALSDSVQVCPVQLPGRETRFGEPPFTRLPNLIAALAESLNHYVDQPFALFGHSLGALVAFELARNLCRQGRRAPVHLFVSGCRAPHLAHTDRWAHTLPDGAFRDELRRLNGTPAELLDNDELMDLLLPTLRADFALFETYDYRSGSPLRCPITALGGRDDEGITREDLDAWHTHTRARFQRRVLPGDHFFLRNAQTLVWDEIRCGLSRAMFSPYDVGPVLVSQAAVAASA